MDGAVVLDFHPRLGHFVEPLERQFGDAFEHLQEPPLERPPERLLFPVLIGAVGQRSFMNNTNA